MTGARTVSSKITLRLHIFYWLLQQVPRVFINGKFVGGGTDIKRMYEMGELQKYFQ